MSEITEGFRNKLRKWKKAFEGYGLEVNLWKSKDLFIGCIAKGGFSICNVLFIYVKYVV